MNQPQKAPIQGIYEVCIGTTDPLPLIQYWQQFGYRIGSIGDLSAPVADQLYQVNSSLRSIRLYHQGADHGLIRLMVWEKPLNQGLQMTSMKVLGNRWATTLTADLMTLWNHAQKAIDVGMPVKYLPPQWTVIYEAVQAKPFLDPIIGVREMLLLQPLTRQVLFQRFNYDVPNYGQIHPMAFFKTSQATHLGMIIQDDSQEVLKFYDEVLGLLRVQDNLPSTYETSTGGKLIFELQPDEELFVTAFDDPRSSLHWQDGRSGRLYVVRFPDRLELPNFYDQAKPGCLGMSLYTYRVLDLPAYFERIKISKAKNITEITTNEFGELSFSFTALDGYFWTLIAL